MASKVNIVINGKNLASKAIKDVTKDLSEAGDASNRFNDGMMKLAKFGLGTAIASVGAAMTASLASLKKSADFSDIRMGFETLLGSYSEAEKMLSSLQGLASKTPLQLNSVTEAATQMLAVGTDKNLVTSELKMLGDLAMGNEQKFGLLTDAYAKLRAKGKVSLEEVNRFTENGVPLLGQLAKNLGVSNAELQKMVSSGKIKLKDIQAAMKDLTEEGGMFFGMMEKKSQGVNGKLSTLRDNLSMTMIKWGTAFEPLAGKLLDNAIKKLDEFSTSEAFNSFVETTVRWATWAANEIPKVGLTISLVGAIIATTVQEAKEQLDKIGSFIIQTPVVKAVIEMGGAVWDALKKGFTGGGWSDLFGVGLDVFSAGLSILATVQLASAIGPLIWTGILSSLLKSGFVKYGGLSSTGVIAAASIAIGLIEAIDDGGYEKFGKDLALALAIGIGIGTFTKSPKAGMLAFTIVMNLEWGEKILDFSEFHPIQDIKNWFEDPQSLANSLRASFIDIWRMSGIYAWLQGYGNDVGEEFGGNLLDSFLKVIRTFDLVGAFVDLWEFHIKPLATHISNYGDELGKNFINSFWRVISVFDLVGAFVDLWNIYLSPMLITVYDNGKSIGENLLNGFKQGVSNIWNSATDKVGEFFNGVIEKGKKILGIQSPSKVMAEIGKFTILGFAQGMDKQMDASQSQLEAIPQGVVDTFRNVLDVHSPSPLFKSIGGYAISSLIDGFDDMTYLQKLDALVKKAFEIFLSFEDIDISGKTKEVMKKIFGGDDDSTDPVIFKGFWNGFFTGIGDVYNDSGLKSAIGYVSQSTQALFGGMFTKITDQFGFFFSAIGTKIANSGFGKFIGKAGNFVGGVADSVGSFFSSLTSKIANIKIGGTTVGDRVGGAMAALAPLMDKLGSGLASSITSLSSFAAIMDPVSTIIAAAMTVLEPLINKALAPLLGILTIVGKTIGGVLAPVFELLASVTEILGRGFVWFYNRAILPVANGIISVFNILYNAVAAVVNGIGNALRWLGVKMSMDYRSLDAGKLQAIDYAAMTASASTYTGSSSTGGSSSSVNQVTVNYYQTINGNVIGDSGMAELGDFFVRAVEAYIGSGGTVRFIQETA